MELNMDVIKLHILSPEGTLVETAVSLVSLPGIVSPFTVLPGHAALVTALVAGNIRYVEDGAEKRLFSSKTIWFWALLSWEVFITNSILLS